MVDLTKLKNFLGVEVWRQFFISALIGCVWFAAESSFVLVTRGYLLSLGVVSSEKLFLPAWYPDSLLFTTGLLFLSGLLRGSVVMLRNYSAASARLSFITRQRSRILEYSLEHAAQLSSHETMSVFGELVKEAGDALYHMARFCTVVIATALLLMAGFHLAPRELSVGLVLLAIGMLPFRYLNFQIRDHGHALLKRWKLVTETLVLGFRNHFLLRVYDILPQEIRHGQEQLGSYDEHSRKYQKIEALKSAFPIIAGISIISLLSYLGHGVFNTSGVALLSFFYIFIRIAQGLSEASQALTILRFNWPGFRTLMAWDSRSTETTGPRIALATSDSNTLRKQIAEEGVTLSARGLCFHYDGQKSLLEDLNFDVKQGESLLIQGPSGSGKSTLLNLALGLRSPVRGSLQANGVSPVTLRSLLAECSGYVGPESYLISATLRENLLYGYRGPALSDEKIWEALRFAQVANDLRRLPGGLDFILRETAPLSTGQKQRLAIARALLRKPKLLILDEATANLDAQSEACFVRELHPLLKTVTTLIISHKNIFDEIATSKISLGRNEFFNQHHAQEI